MRAVSRYYWSTACAWGLTIAVGVLAVVGVLATFLSPGGTWDVHLRSACVVSFAAVCGLALANANNAAAAAMHAASRLRLHWQTFVPAAVCAVGYGSASIIGVHLGWEYLTHGATNAELPNASQVLWAALFLAFAKPAMTWVIEGRRIMDRADADAAEEAENARLDAIRQAAIAARAENVTQFRPRSRRTAVTAAGAAAIASIALLGAPPTRAEVAPQMQQDAPSQMQPDASEAAGQAQRDAPKPKAKTRSRVAARRDTADYEARVAEARRLLLTTQSSNRQIARQTGLSASSVDRLARIVTPLAAPIS